MPHLIDSINQIASKSHFENIPGVGCHSPQALFLNFLTEKKVYEVNYQNNTNDEAGIWDKEEQMQFCLEPLKLTVVI